jgi:hypothetical protein
MPPATDSKVLTTILNTMSSKENEYKEGIRENAALCNSMADRLVPGGDLEDTLMNSNLDGEGKPIIPPEEIQAFFEEQRNRLKSLATQNAERERRVDAFIGAINNLKQQASAAEQEDGPPDYEVLIEKLMKEEHERLAESMPDFDRHEFVRQVRERLGEQDESAQNEGDDDIEVVRNKNTQNVAMCKCPVTAGWMEDAVKNKICPHVFSRAGITSQMRNGKCTCPTYGCGKQITLDSLEDDFDMVRLVKRMKRKEEMENEKRAMTQAELVDDDDDEE